MEWESDSPYLSHTYPEQGHRSPRRCRGWELERRDCGAILGWELLLTAERWTKGTWGRRLWRAWPVEESQAAMEARDTAESCVRAGAITIASLSPHTSIGSWTIERLAHQAPDAPIYRVGPQPGDPSMFLMCGKQRRIPGKGALPVPEQVKLQRKTSPRGCLTMSFTGEFYQ